MFSKVFRPLSSILRMTGGASALSLSLDFSQYGDGAIPVLGGATWTISSGKAINTPATESDLVTNGNMELTTGWTDYNSPTSNERSSEQAHGGTYSRKLVTTGASNQGCSQTLSGSIGKWYQISGWYYVVSGGGYGTFTWDSSMAKNTTTTDAWEKINVAAYRKVNASNNLYLYGHSGSASTLYVDDVSVLPITFSSLSASKQFSISDVKVTAALTIASGWVGTTLGGVVARAQDTTYSNCLICYYDKSDFKIHLCEVIAGATTEIYSGAASFVAAAELELRLSGTTAKIFYNGVQIGADQVVTNTTGKYHGLFCSAGMQAGTFAVSPF
jgi:hypothetical protein